MRLRRIAARVVLCAFAAWEILAFSDNLQILRGKPQRYPEVTWPVVWQMFTFRSDGQEDVGFEGRWGETWVRLPMPEWYPAAWESGYRWERAAFNRERLSPYLVAACERSGADEVRAVRLTWKRRLGTAAQFPAGPTRTVKGTRRCR